MEKTRQLVLFTLGPNRFGLSLETVERVVTIVEITPLPRAPDIVLGVINVHGEIIPVFDVRKRLGLAPRALLLQDQMILARTTRRRIALLVETVTGVVARSEQDWVSSDQIMPNLQPIAGLLALHDGLVLIQDLEQFLSHSEEEHLDRALEQL